MRFSIAVYEEFDFFGTKYGKLIFLFDTGATVIYNKYEQSRLLRVKCRADGKLPPGRKIAYTDKYHVS